jgi:hypothetical protein
MKETMDMSGVGKWKLGRRGFLGAAGGLAAAPLLAGTGSQAIAQTAGASGAEPETSIGRRRLGRLEVSAIGLGVQNMSRTYHTGRMNW